MGRKRARAGKLLYFCVAGLMLLLLSACPAAIPRRTLLHPASTQEPPAESLQKARNLLDRGDFAGALRENEKVFSRAGLEPPGGEALFQMGLIYAHPDNPQRQCRWSQHLFRRVVKEYPRSPFAPEARVWVRMLEENDQLHRSLERMKEAQGKLNQSLEKMKESHGKLNQSLEKAKEENQRLQQVIRQSKQVDIEVEEKKRERTK